MTKLVRSDDQFTDEASVLARLDALERGLYNSGGVGPSSTTLPSGPSNGQEARLQVTGPIWDPIWSFKYRTASPLPNKWEFIGGSPLWMIVNTAEVTTSTSYHDLTTVGPSVTVPRTGTYLIEWGVGRVVNQTGSNIGFHASIKVGTGTPQDATSLGEMLVTPSAPVGHGSRSYFFNATANDQIRIQYRHVTGAALVEKRWISVIPIVVS